VFRSADGGYAAEKDESGFTTKIGGVRRRKKKGSRFALAW